MIEVSLPCKIGDLVWSARKYNGTSVIRCAPVVEMFFTSEMELIIVSRGVGRGKWGVHIFPTKEAAEAAFANPEHECIPSTETIRENTDTLCWQCKKSGGLCSWSHDATPVKGWTAIQTYRNGINDDCGYTVVKCPEFEEG